MKQFYTRDSHVRSALIGASTLLCILASAGPAVALINCSMYPVTVDSGNFTAGDDYEVTDSTTCFTVYGGYDVNLNSHTVTCSNPAGCGTAVVIYDSSAATVVKNGTIKGPFEIGVEVWAGSDGTGVTTIQSNKFDGVQAAIQGGKQIKQNVITGCLIGVEWTPNNVQGADSQYVQDNYIDCNDAESVGIKVSSSYTRSSGSPKVQTNFVRAVTADINAPNSSQNLGKSNITKNVATTPASPDALFAPIKAFGEFTTVAGDNVCDADGAGINSDCTLPTPPFIMP